MPISPDKLPDYQPATPLEPGPRKDGQRIRDIVRTVDATHDEIPQGSFVLVGYAAENAVVRNFGRRGTREGRDAVIGKLAPLPIERSAKPIVDGGSIVEQTDNTDSVEQVQQQFGTVVRRVFEQGSVPIGIGGGYDMVWPFVQAWMDTHRNKKVAVISMSPYSNVRPLENGKGNSGTEFAQIAEEAQRRGVTFDYLVYGYQRDVNTDEHAKKMREVKATRIDVRDIHSDNPLRRWKARLQLWKFVKLHPSILLTMEMNVFAEPFAPGVSAVSPFGLMPGEGREIVEQIAKSGHLAGALFAETSRALDDKNGETACLAAGMIVSTIGSYREPKR